MSCSALYFIIAALAVVVIVGGYFLYQQQHQVGLQIKIGDHAVTIDGN